MVARKISRKKELRNFILAIVVVAFGVVMLSKSGPVGNTFVPDPVLTQKAQILALATATPLTSERRQTLYQELGGQKFLQYHFTPAEKSIIINSLNQK